jgi:hypothetical protein
MCVYKISGTGSCYHQSEITNVYKCRGGPDFRHLYQHFQTTRTTKSSAVSLWRLARLLCFTGMKMPSPMKIEVGDFPLKCVKLPTDNGSSLSDRWFTHQTSHHRSVWAMGPSTVTINGYLSAATQHGGWTWGYKPYYTCKDASHKMSVKLSHLEVEEVGTSLLVEILLPSLRPKVVQPCPYGKLWSTLV